MNTIDAMENGAQNLGYAATLIENEGRNLGAAISFRKSADSLRAAIERERNEKKRDCTSCESASGECNTSCLFDEVFLDQSEDVELVKALTAIVRDCDRRFERIGGTSRNWVSEHFLFLLNSEGYKITKLTPKAGRLEAENAKLRQALDQGCEALERTRTATNEFLRGMAITPDGEDYTAKMSADALCKFGTHLNLIDDALAAAAPFREKGEANNA